MWKLNTIILVSIYAICWLSDCLEINICLTQNLFLCFYMHYIVYTVGWTSSRFNSVNKGSRKHCLVQWVLFSVSHFINTMLLWCTFHLSILKHVVKVTFNSILCLSFHEHSAVVHIYIYTIILKHVVTVIENIHLCV